ncbi:hypothetical protein [Burkholderia seminalis]|uniref:hypothetical protein n=1 Tax=Burkholderia seminalis TaxID=488731 RepID=UPI0019065D32|nr:hypothetical protein [Burkholderia seminalis]MBJ9964461.1 hypothetical protein [Burkholderia seminalis]
MNTIAELRAHLFDTLQKLNDKENPMEIERAKAVSEVAQVIINSAKVEVEFMKASGGKGTGFIPEKSDELPNGITGIHRHIMQG